MTNWDKWMKYTEGLSSPENFVQWGYIYCIAACLQRRVWLGDTINGLPADSAMFANMNVILTAEPGIGKGLVIKAITSLLRHWKLADITGNDNIPAEHKDVAEATQQGDLTTIQKNEYQGKNIEIIKPTLFPIAADATTFEALVEAVSESYRRINYIQQINGESKLKIYGHSSLCFLLPELSSLLRKRTNDTVNYLLGLYDCPTDFEYRTKNSGRDRVRRGCINLLAGTTPAFIQSTFDDSLLDEGFTSRTFFIYAPKNRKNQFDIPPLSENQLECKNDLLEHIKKLSRLYGQVQYGEGVLEYLREWWDNVENNKNERPNKSPKLIPYYSRKNIHVMKVALAKHFGESTDLLLGLDTVKWAIDFLGRDEQSMHLAIQINNTKISRITRKILELLSSGPKCYVDIAIGAHGICETQEQLKEAIEFLQLTAQVKSKTEETELGEERMIWFI